MWSSGQKRKEDEACQRRAQRRADRVRHPAGRSRQEVTDVCREMGVSVQAFYSWKRPYAGVGVSELRELRQLRDANRKLKTLVADLTLDKHILQEVLSKKSKACGAPGAGREGAAGTPVDGKPCLRADRNHTLVESLSDPEGSANGSSTS